MQDPDQAPGGNWGWGDARRLYLSALTDPDARTREAAAADLFRALGQIMHLVVDAGVPEHTRNDPHPFGTISRRLLNRRKAGNYEYWVSDQHSGGTASTTATAESGFRTRYLSDGLGFDPNLFGIAIPDGEARARVPIARLIDTDRYVAASPDPNVTMSGSIGLAEFANANFFSEDTLHGAFPFPRREFLTPNPRLAPRSSRVRAYFAKPPGQGLPTAVALAECLSERSIGRWVVTGSAPYPCVDEAVWEETAAHMLPRAVGYARGVLDYFFRGAIGVRLYRADGQVVVRIENLTDEEMDGVFEVYARPMTNTPRESRQKVVIVNGGAPAKIAPKAIVTLPATLLPAQHPTAAQVLVFRGRLGLEDNAVAAQIFDVPHVLITQTGFTSDLSETCRTSTFFSNLHTASCEWRSINNRVSGELATDEAVPAIARISTTSPLMGRPALEIDDVTMPGGEWLRRADEPDPRRFRVAFSAGNPHGLALRVELVNGTVVSTPLMALLMATGSAMKHFTHAPYGSNPPWHISARRSAVIRVTANTAYRTLSIGGHANPTDVVTDRFSVAQLREHIRVRSIIPSEVMYSQQWVDYAEVFTSAPPGGPVILDGQLEDMFTTLPFGPPPRVPVEAVVERLYDPADLEFLRTFVTMTAPASTFTIVGRRQAGT